MGSHTHYNVHGLIHKEWKWKQWSKNWMWVFPNKVTLYIFFAIRQCLCLFQTSPTEVAVATILALYSSMVHPPPPVAENEPNDVMNGSVINVCSWITFQFVFLLKFVARVGCSLSPIDPQVWSKLRATILENELLSPMVMKEMSLVGHRPNTYIHLNFN